MTEKYLMLDLNDANSLLIAEIMSNKTCKKILNLLAEKEMSEGDIAKTLKIPINTIDYNIKKMIKAGLIEKTKNFFWSVKGKKIENYKLANKKIVISTKPKLKGFIPAILVSGLFAVGIKYIFQWRINLGKRMEDAAGVLTEKNINLASNSADSSISYYQEFQDVTQNGFFQTLFNNNPVWAWFLFGALFGIFIVWLVNIQKKDNSNGLKGGKN